MSSRNDRAPNNYQRKFTISVHALERFRERVDDEFRARSDLDLGNLLDDKLRHPEQQYTVRDPRAPEETTHLYAIETRRRSCYVVVRNETAVTVLDPDMARRNFQETWAQVMNTPFIVDSLRDVRKAIQGTPPKIQPPPDDLPLRTPPPETTTTLTELEQAGLHYARVLRRCHEAAQAVERTQAAAIEAEAALQITRDECTAALQALTTLAEGSKDV
jgi:hypothetical protein